jgi:serine/threonine protein kinase
MARPDQLTLSDGPCLKEDQMAKPTGDSDSAPPAPAPAANPDQLAHTATLSPSDAVSLPPKSRSLRMVDPADYTVEYELARGGMGRISAGYDCRHGRPVAIKELLVEDPASRARFEREAFVTARLQHPSIVAVYEAGRWPSGEPFYAMKMVSGRPLNEVIAGAKTLDERLALLPHVIAW